MIYVFEDGRTLYTEELLRSEDTGKYVAVEALPEIPEVTGQVGYVVANLGENKLEFRYFDAPETEESQLDRIERVVRELEARIIGGTA